MSLGTQSEWGWHSFVDTSDYKREEALKEYHLNGRKITYAIQWNEPQRNKNAANWFRQNPHRLQLGHIGFELVKKDESLATIMDIQNVRQELNPYTRQVKTHFSLEGIPVDVLTFSHQQQDLISVQVKSDLIRQKRLKIFLRFPYPTGEWLDEGANFVQDEKHISGFQSVRNASTFYHQLDTTKYYVECNWQGNASVSQKKPHYYIISPAGENLFEFNARFGLKESLLPVPTFAQTKNNNLNDWRSFWGKGGVIEFSGSTDPRAHELERRVVLSQYLMKVQDASNFPPQETGLTYNSWFGKPHLEMTWWHAAHYGFWGRIEYIEKLLNWYASVAAKGKAIAQRQGFDGVRWQKMTDNKGDETPSSIGALLIWQQPHYIYFAEQCYRHYGDAKTLNKYKDLVFATADFMASFAYYDSATKRYILGKGLIPAQERFKAEETFNPAYELVYWHWALSVAQEWRERLKLPRNKRWNEVLKNLATLPVQEGKYLFAESATDSYTNPEYRTDHPSVLAALGVMPSTGQVNQTVMQNTFDWIWKNWAWTDTWGWDFPMTAMTATRLGQPDKAVDALLMDIPTNTYLSNGHNYQDERLRLYLPGNGGLLTAVAMMVAGYDGAKQPMPGIPKNGKWKVRWEGLKRMP